MTEKESIEFVKSCLKQEMSKRDLTYSQMVDKLNELGINETFGGFRNKMSRGTFSASFFIQCLSMLGCKNVKLED